MTPDPLLKYSLSQIQKAVLTHNQNKLALTCFWQSGSGSQTQWCNGSKYRGRKKLNPGERRNMHLFFSPLTQRTAFEFCCRAAQMLSRGNVLITCRL